MYINNVEFAKNQQSLNGKIDLNKLVRIQDLLDNLTGEISFVISGNVDQMDKALLNIKIYGKICTLCQSCLKDLTFILDNESSIAIFSNESELDNALFGIDNLYNDGILENKEFNVLEFIEDEIIMLLPISPRHESCKFSTSYNDTQHNPFSILKK